MDDTLEFSCPKCQEAILYCDVQKSVRYEAIFTKDGDVDLDLLPDTCDQDEDDEVIWYCANCGEIVLRGSKSDLIEHLEGISLAKNNK